MKEQTGQAGLEDVRGMSVAVRWRRVASKLVYQNPEEWDYLPSPHKTDSMLDDLELPQQDRKRGR